MRPLRVVVVVALLSIGNLRGQETTPTPPAAEAVRAPAGEVPGSPNSLARRPSWGARLATWRPISRWLSRTSGTQETVAAPATVALAQPVGGTDAIAPAAPTVNPAEGDPGATPPVPGDRARTTAAGTEGTSPGSVPISANPAAVDIIAGTGALGRLLGFDKDSGIRLGGLWIGDTSGVLSGGKNPGAWAFNSLTIADLNLDMEKLFGLTGGSFGMEFLQFTGQNTNGLAGAFPGFDSIEAGPPFERNQLYELWYRQVLFDDRLIIRIGKSVPTFDFNNVVRPVPVGDDPSAVIPAVTALAYTPVFVNPTMLGVIPGYYNSATGITATLAPIKSIYLNYGVYDGNAANPNPALRNTGLSGPHFNGYYFHIGEFGYAYRLGEQRKPGNFGVGVWGQTGKLQNFTGGFSEGADGAYLFGSQRLWFRHPGVDSSGVSGFYQFGANNSNALLARYYVGGGLTAFGLVPARPDDSFGAGLNCTWLTGGTSAAGALYPPDTPMPNQLRPSQLMFQCYYQMKLVNGVFFQTNLTDIPTPGIPTLTTGRPSFPNALAITLRLTFLF
jgi:porin